MFSSIFSKLKSAVSFKDPEEAAGGERVGSTPVVPAQLVESPMGDKHTEKEAEATPEKEISDKKGRRHSTTPVAAPKGDSEPVETPNKSPAAKLAEMATGGGDEGAEVKKGKKRRGKKKKTDTSERSIEEQAAGAAKAVPKKDGGSGKEKTDAELEKENAKLMAEITKVTRKYRTQQEEIAKANRERKAALSVAAQLYQIGMAIEPEPPRARTDSFALPKLPAMGEQTRRGAETARVSGYSRRESQQQGQSHFLMEGSDAKRSSTADRPTTDLNHLIKEAKARQALLRAQSQTKLAGDSSGKSNPEDVRSRLRTGNTKQDLEAAIKEAKDLGMTYEVTLAEKKLEGIEG
ncbi:Cylicin-2, putative [Perkinsus marinus ATCC 50983]|uniref:Cylicin-2, putative n=1 Tax=Perkinsus marinus (strain ATCC 50983 / TXsc) TaxID=423536 RepID=C5L2C1_PERM5|nr:Cylicin-2, putative [Perkinsus marinus ATCC 50983]EER09133.1 Cylicin-2, putative [Perkinsus marinus ATCC 50983]|eukprot:XP_002777317.1 Cylicin-2, putative [Perkinsus marinus ATCC 50983]